MKIFWRLKVQSTKYNSELHGWWNENILSLDFLIFLIYLFYTVGLLSDFFLYGCSPRQILWGGGVAKISKKTRDIFKHWNIKYKWIREFSHLCVKIKKKTNLFHQFLDFDDFPCQHYLSRFNNSVVRIIAKMRRVVKTIQIKILISKIQKHEIKWHTHVTHHVA